MITNLIATVIVSLVTNTYAPKQHLETTYYTTYPMQVEEVWVDSPSPDPWRQHSLLDTRQRERDNPDVRITEVREVKTISFEFEGIVYRCEASNTVISRKKQVRVVQTEEKWVDEGSARP